MKWWSDPFHTNPNLTIALYDCIANTCIIIYKNNKTDGYCIEPCPIVMYYIRRRNVSVLRQIFGLSTSLKAIAKILVQTDWLDEQLCDYRGKKLLGQLGLWVHFRMYSEDTCWSTWAGNEMKLYNRKIKSTTWTHTVDKKLSRRWLNHQRNLIHKSYTQKKNKQARQPARCQQPVNRCLISLSFPSTAM